MFTLAYIPAPPTVRFDEKDRAEARALLRTTAALHVGRNRRAVWLR
jgi:hypothetical protein